MINATSTHFDGATQEGRGEESVRAYSGAGRSSERDTPGWRGTRGRKGDTRREREGTSPGERCANRGGNWLARRENVAYTVVMLSSIKKLATEDSSRSWECSYVMSSGNGVNLLGKLDVDMNRARFVATAGLFGTACRG